MADVSIKLWDDREVARLGMGGWPIAGPFYAGDLQLGYAAIDDRDAVALLRRAVADGIRFFDTAAVYGAGHSEALLGEAFGNRDDVVIATKFGPVFDEASKQATGQNLGPQHPRTAVEASLRRLKRERIDLYQLHVNTAPIAKAIAIFDTLDDLVRAGKIGAYGWSTDFPASIDAVAPRPNFVAVQHTMNVFFDAPTMLAAVERLGLVSIDRMPFAMGILGGEMGAGFVPPADDIRRNTFDWMDYFKEGRIVPRFVEQLEAVGELLRTGGRSTAQGALGWLWAKSKATLPIPGFRSIRHADDTIGALAHGPLPQAAMDEIEAVIAREPEGPARER